MENNLMEFLSNPSFADIVAYFFIVIIFVCESFMKKFVKKDNFLTMTKVNDDVKKLKVVHEELVKTKQTLEEERAERKQEILTWQKEKQELLKEQKKQAQAIALIAGNKIELVKSGVANKVAEMLSVNIDENLKSVEINQVGGGNKDE